MRKIVKNMGLMLLIVLLLAFFSSCGSEEELDKTDTDKEALQTEEAELQAEKEFAEKMIMPEDLGTTEDLNKFATIDIYGNPVGNEIFADYQYTIIDVWGTYCAPCINAMPGLKKVYDEYKDKGVNVMGIVIDVQEADRTPQLEAVQNARTIVETQGADFTHMLIPKNLLYSFLEDVQFIPTQFMVDSEGNIISDLFKGGKSYDDWCKLLDEKLESQ